MTFPHLPCSCCLPQGSLLGVVDNGSATLTSAPPLPPSQRAIFSFSQVALPLLPPRSLGQGVLPPLHSSVTGQRDRGSPWPQGKCIVCRFVVGETDGLSGGMIPSRFACFLSAAIRQAVGGGCQSGWGLLLSDTKAIEAGTWRQGDTGWAYAGRPEGGGGLPPPFPMHPCPPPPLSQSSFPQPSLYPQLPMDLSYDPKFTAVEARTKGLDVQKSQGHGIFWNIPAGTQLDYNPQYNLTSPRTSGAPEFASGPEYARPPIRSALAPS